MHLWSAALLAVCLQDDPFKVLADPALRSKEVARKAAADACRAKALESPRHWAAAELLLRPDWKLAGPAAADLDAVLAKHWAAATADEASHKASLAALVQAVDKHAKSDPGSIFHVLAMAEVAVLGDRAAEAAVKLGLAKEGDRWGRKDQLAHYAVAAGFSKPAYIPAEAEKAAKASPRFGPRYVAALLEIQKTLSANTGYEALWKSLQALGKSAPEAEAAFLNGLAGSVRHAAGCRSCEKGKTSCDRCGGSKRTDVTCRVCKGNGWMQKGVEANRLVKCTGCRGGKVFRNAACPTCKAKGVLECPVCLGKGWRDNFKGCAGCFPCTECHGRRVAEKACVPCGGKGRTGPVVLGTPTILCADCKGEAILKEDCRACKQSGLAPCPLCRGSGPRDGKSTPKVEDVYKTEPCAPCGGRGWPLPNVAIACDACHGLGVRVRPSRP